MKGTPLPFIVWAIITLGLFCFWLIKLLNKSEWEWPSTSFTSQLKDFHLLIKGFNLRIFETLPKDWILLWSIITVKLLSLWWEEKSADSQVEPSSHSPSLIIQ